MSLSRAGAALTRRFLPTSTLRGGYGLLEPSRPVAFPSLSCLRINRFGFPVAFPALSCLQVNEFAFTP